MKPILFNTPMTRAVDIEWKTATRRLLKPQPAFPGYPEGINVRPERCDDGSWCFAMDPFAMLCEGSFIQPYDEGDILYVREAWSMAPDILRETPGPVFRADFTDAELQYLKEKHFRWKPSIHMPARIARIFLRVNKVRVERLQDITPDQCAAEGIEPFSGPVEARAAYYISSFAALWDTTIQKEDLSKYGWDANPWVWVVEFERCEEPDKEACGRDA